MPYLVRKVIKKANLDELNHYKNLDTVAADIPTTEFRTKNHCLSTWIIDSLECIEQAVLAIATVSGEIATMDFIAIDTEILDKFHLSYSKTDPGRTVAVEKLQNTHYDIQNLTLKSIRDCCEIYQTINANQPACIFRYTKGEIKNLLHDALRNQDLNINLLEERVKKALIS